MSMDLPGEWNPTAASDVGLPENPEDGRALAFEEYHALLRAAEQLFDEVDRALASLDEGTYGCCGVCGTTLDDRDLMEDPLMTRCASHQVSSGD